MATLSVLANTNIVGNGTPGSCTENALRTAVQRGGTVTFSCGSNPHTITVSDDIVVSTTTIIDGGGTQQGGRITISGGNRTRVFRMENQKNLTVRNLTIRDGKEPGFGSGGAINGGWRGELVIENSIFDNNDGRAGNHEQGAGAVFMDIGNITVRNSLFTNNKGINGGGVHIVGGKLLIERSTFINNQTESGGSSIHGNGGGVYTDGAGTKFNPGQPAGNSTIRDSVFIGNRAEKTGGAMHLWGYEPDRFLVENVVVEDNLVVRNRDGLAEGGGIYIGGTTFELRNITINNNTSRYQGGGLYIHPASRATMTNMTITDNRAVDDKPDGFGGLGGGIAGGAPITCTNCTIARNHAEEHGGGIYNVPGSRLVNSVVAYNTSDNPWGIFENCRTTMTDGGGNIQYPGRNSNSQSDRNCTDSIRIVDPKLEELRNNGGVLQTIGLQIDSPAIDNGTGSGCPSIDARGVSRPQDGNGDGRSTCDSGSFERTQAAQPTATRTNQPASPTPTSGGGALTCNGTQQGGPWSMIDIGSAASRPGTTIVNGGTVFLCGSGTQLWSTNDGLRYVYQNATGSNYTIVARLTDMDTVHPLTKIGLMLRGSTGANAQHFSVMMTESNAVRVQWRSTTNASSSDGGGAGPNVPVIPTWLRIVKNGDTLQAAYSVASNPGSNDWVNVGAPQRVELPVNYLAGMFASSRDSGQLASATFTSISLSGSGAPTATPTAPPLALECGNPSVNGAWSSTDIGTASSLPGTTISQRSTVFICGAGNQVWSTSDGLRYVYQNVQNDIVTIVARVIDWETPERYTKVGVMIRSSVASVSAHFSVMVTREDGVRVQWRSSTGGISTDGGSAGPSQPVIPTWLRVTRNNGQLQAYYSTASAPGTNDWVAVGQPVSISFPTVATAGMFVSSRNASKLASGTFTSPIIFQGSAALNPIVSAEDEPTATPMPIDQAEFSVYMPYVKRR
ncbi:MAG: hypothetical protein HC876_15260 [Chloroflexaceae bacterium]|nr:hypothetical protein [Chloroflexaceae bacterium]